MINEAVSNSVVAPELVVEQDSALQAKPESKSAFDPQQFMNSMIDELTTGDRGFTFVERIKSLRENSASFSTEQLEALHDFVASSEVREKCNADRLSPDSSGWNTVVNVLQAVINDRKAR